MSLNESHSEAPASAAYRIRMLHRKVGRGRRLLRTVWTTIVLSTPLAVLVDDKWEIPERHWIEVIDKASDEVLVTYSHRLRSDARQHWASLRDRLHGMTASEFAEDLGLGTLEADRDADRSN